MFQAVLIDATQSYFDAVRSPTAVSILNRKRVIDCARVVQFFLCSYDDDPGHVAFHFPVWILRLFVGRVVTTHREWIETNIGIIGGITGTLNTR